MNSRGNINATPNINKYSGGIGSLASPGRMQSKLADSAQNMIVSSPMPRSPPNNFNNPLNK